MPTQLCPGESEDSPTENLKVIVPFSIPLERMSVHVPGIAVELDRQSLVGIGEVDVDGSSVGNKGVLGFGSRKLVLKRQSDGSTPAHFG